MGLNDRTQKKDMVLLDIAEEVLLRLTVKDLVRCKSVCKLCYSLISSPAFNKTHVKFISNKNNKQLGNIRIAMTRRYVIRKGDTCTIPPEWESSDSLRIQGSSNGLVCMSSLDNNRVCLINPSTREFRELQKPPIIHTEYLMTLYAQRYGFGYDSSTDDYKLVMAMNQAKEEFREIPQPEDMRYEATYSSTLGIFEDNLCICHERNDGHPYGIWVMKTYNVRQSWKLLPTECEMKDRVHYMVKDCLLSRKMPSYFCCVNTFLSTSGKYIWSPIFVQTLVSPFVNNNGRPSDSENNKRIAEEGNSKERREIEEVYTLKDGEKNGYNLVEDVEIERKKRKRKSSKSGKKKK